MDAHVQHTYNNTYTYDDTHDDTHTYSTRKCRFRGAAARVRWPRGQGRRSPLTP